MYFKGKNVAVLGWGISGLDVASYLQGMGAKLTILDQKEEKDLDFAGFDSGKTRLILGKNYLHSGLGDFDYVFRSPGVYRYLPEIVRAEKKGVVITSAAKLFFDLSTSKIIGITGTKGKGTTSTLIYEILKKSGKNVFLAGNIGNPVLSLLPKLKKKSWVVLELSSFQLIDIMKSPHIAVVLNITEDHMDWHKDKDEYINSKIQIVRFQNKKDFAVINYDHETSRGFAKKTNAEVKYFSIKQKVRGVYVKNGKIIINVGSRKYEVGGVDRLNLRGQHNWENVCAAICAAYIAGASLSSIKRAIFRFKGLEHRLELVTEIEGVRFYNDSFSTNPQTTIAGIRSFEEPITLILGGSNKGLNYAAMGKEIAKRRNIKNIVLIGSISDTLRRSLRKSNYKGILIKLGNSGMREIVGKCFKMAEKGGVVLLSPSTASFDMFENYKERGKAFKDAVFSLQKNKS